MSHWAIRFEHLVVAMALTLVITLGACAYILDGPERCTDGFHMRGGACVPETFGSAHDAGPG